MLVESKTQPHCISAKTNILGCKLSKSSTERPRKKKCRNGCLVSFFFPAFYPLSVTSVSTSLQTATGGRWVVVVMLHAASPYGVVWFGHGANKTITLCQVGGCGFSNPTIMHPPLHPCILPSFHRINARCNATVTWIDQSGPRYGEKAWLWIATC